MPPAEIQCVRALCADPVLMHQEACTAGWYQESQFSPQVAIIHVCAQCQHLSELQMPAIASVGSSRPRVFVRDYDHVAQ